MFCVCEGAEGGVGVGGCLLSWILLMAITQYALLNMQFAWLMGRVSLVKVLAEKLSMISELYIFEGNSLRLLPAVPGRMSQLSGLSPLSSHNPGTSGHHLFDPIDINEMILAIQNV